ncbi:MAG TPA: phosphopentomutase [Ktedonobacterales bacterium]
MSQPALDRVILIVVDGLGVGRAPDAAAYGDVGADSLGHAAAAVGGLALPQMGRLGLGYLDTFAGTPPSQKPSGAYGRMIERAAGKDSVSGHWELMGLTLTRPMPTYPNGFPVDLVERFEAAIGRGVLGNVAASGVEIIQRLGSQSLATGKPILYTSADSVFQLAAHEDVISVDRLYSMCAVARAMLTGEHAVGRVIARPFVGPPGAFVRTPRRKDFALEPPGPTLLDSLVAARYDVIGVGKIGDLFAGRGLTSSVHPGDNAGALAVATERLRRRDFCGLLFVNLVDTDQLYGHRRNPQGYAEALRSFDVWLAEAQPSLAPREALMITGDHGNDPTWRGSDHTREMAPLLVTGPDISSANLGTRQTFADVSATLAELFDVAPQASGTSFAGELKLRHANGEADR